MGSTATVCILMMRWLAPLLYSGPCRAGVYLMYCGAPGAAGSDFGWFAASVPFTRASMTAFVAASVASTTSCSGRARSCAPARRGRPSVSETQSLCMPAGDAAARASAVMSCSLGTSAPCAVCTVLFALLPCFTSAE